MLHSEFEGFDCPVRVMPVQADHNFVIPVNFTGNQMTGKSLTGSNITAVTLNGPLKLHYHDNRLVNVNTGLLFEPDNRVDVISSGGNYIAADISYSGCPAKGTLRFFRPDREEESVIAECGPRSSESPPHTTGSASGYSMTGILPLLMMSWISIELGRGTVSH